MIFNKILPELSVSQIILGGGKMVNMKEEEALTLINTALGLEVNAIDCHHRYGNCEELAGHSKGIMKMSKLSTYNASEREMLISESLRKLGHIHIFWISDLDNEILYETGKKLYKELIDKFPVIGITTESPTLAIKFHEEFPQCQLFMLPLYKDNVKMKEIAKYLIAKGKKVFAIKPFDDGRMFSKYSVRECLKFIKDINPTAVLIGTKNPRHLKECVEIYNKL